MTSDDALREYRSRRDPGRSGEPAGAAVDGKGDRFVVQRHDASSLHFDVRLEVDGVLVSWAVPKGPSTNPSDKRLATRTEDHPLDYATFEGRIPESQYGGGTVIVWDTGVYRNLDERDVGDGLDRGHLKVWLDGEKLRGGYAFTRTATGGDDSDWLLVKVSDEGADRRRRPTRTEPASVLSGRRNEDL